MGSPEKGSNLDFFDNQFERQLGNEIFDILPQNPSDRPVLFVPGWNARIFEYKNALRTLVILGCKRVVSIEPSGSEEEKAGELIRVINLKGFEEIDIIAHSVGTLSSILASLQIPDSIKHLVLLNPPLDEKDPKNLIKKYRDMMRFEDANHIADVGLRKIVEMAKVITSFDTQGLRSKLGGLGTKVTSIHGLQDSLFPAPKTALEMNEDNIASKYSEFYVEGKHLGIDGFISPALKLLEQ